jgi:hypothetical protein
MVGQDKRQTTIPEMDMQITSAQEQKQERKQERKVRIMLTHNFILRARARTESTRKRSSDSPLNEK